MAPGKTHVNLKLKHKFQARKRNSSGVKKAKNSSIPKKKVRSSKGLITFRNIFSFLYLLGHLTVSGVSLCTVNNESKSG